MHDNESVNKMSLHNLATVFGPTVVRPPLMVGSMDQAELLATGTVDVMAQAGIVHFFLNRRANGEPVQVFRWKEPVDNKSSSISVKKVMEAK